MQWQFLDATERKSPSLSSSLTNMWPFDRLCSFAMLHFSPMLHIEFFFVIQTSSTKGQLPPLCGSKHTHTHKHNPARSSPAQVLNLSCNCLSFDFMGTIPDDTSDEQGTAGTSISRLRLAPAWPLAGIWVWVTRGPQVLVMCPLTRVPFGVLIFDPQFEPSRGRASGGLYSRPGHGPPQLGAQCRTVSMRLPLRGFLCNRITRLVSWDSA